MTRSGLVPLLLTVGAALLWGSSFTVVKIGLGHADPYSFVLLRFAVAAAVLVAVVAAKSQWRKLVAYLRDPYVLALGLTISVSFGFQFRGQTETTAAKAAIIINSSGVLVAPMSYVLLKERIGLRKLGALAVGLFGVYLVAAPAGAGKAAAAASTLRGDLLVAVSALAYGFYVVLTKMAVSRRSFSEVPMMAAVFLWSLPAFLVLNLPSAGTGFRLNRDAWLATLYLAVFCTVAPFLLWTFAIKYIGAVTSSVLLFAELVFGAFLAHLVLGDALSTGVLAGCGLICAGIFIVGSEHLPGSAEADVGPPHPAGERS